MTIYDRDAITDPGRPLVLHRNVSGGILLRGTPVIIDTATIDGVGVTSVVTSALVSLFAGVAFEDLSDGDYGRFQVAGYCDYARVAGHGVNPTAIGDVLTLTSGQTYFTRLSAGSGAIWQATSLEVVGIGASVAARKVWLGPGC